MGIFDGVLICTDLDGTLLRNDKSISPENLEAIAYFKQEGGYFTFITGRMPFFVDRVLQAVDPNAPFGCINGAGLYDAAAQSYVWTAQMPEQVLSLVEFADRQFENIGIQVNTFHTTYFCKENSVMANFRRLTGVANAVKEYTQVQEPIAKILFGCETEEELQALSSALGAHPLADRFDFIRSEERLYEILPKGINKGTSIQQLCRHLQLDIRRTVAIGDYNNDIAMFRAAGTGIAVANACEDALRAADHITVSNEEHAIARVIEDLQAGKYL